MCGSRVEIEGYVIHVYVWQSHVEIEGYVIHVYVWQSCVVYVWQSIYSVALPCSKRFRSTPNGVLTAHTEWLQGVPPVQYI